MLLNAEPIIQLPIELFHRYPNLNTLGVNCVYVCMHLCEAGFQELGKQRPYPPEAEI